MNVPCQIDETELEAEDGRLVHGVIATCSRCSHSTESYGTSDRSIKRCLALLREECPNDESNFYAYDDAVETVAPPVEYEVPRCDDDLCGWCGRHAVTFTVYRYSGQDWKFHPSCWTQLQQFEDEPDPFRATEQEIARVRIRVVQMRARDAELLRKFPPRPRAVDPVVTAFAQLALGW